MIERYSINKCFLFVISRHVVRSALFSASSTLIFIALFSRSNPEPQRRQSWSWRKRVKIWWFCSCKKKDFYNHAVTVFVLKTYRKHIQNLGYPPFPVLLITIMNTRLVGDSHEDSFKPLFLGSGTTPFITDSNCTCWIMLVYRSNLWCHVYI